MLSGLDIMLQATLTTIHHGFHILLIAGFVYAMWDRYRTWRGLSGVLALVDASQPRPKTRLWRAARAAGLDPARVRVVRWLPDPAFTVGWLYPTIYVARPLIRCLNTNELVAVLAHERAHLIRRDPLRLAVLRLIACGLFWIPVLRQLVADVADETEVRADDAALAHAGNRPMALASAIMRAAQLRIPRMSQPSQWALATTSFTRPKEVSRPEFGRGLLERRVRRLVGEDPPIATHVTRIAMTIAMTTLLLGWVSGIMAMPR
jgi:Zn-dependent protease with chaperone function